ncbi:MAG: hypothetical protein LC737_05230, partial [Chloroflexi bacterium]|nr:hypothetical protein [Chloroflexota bacterium]
MSTEYADLDSVVQVLRSQVSDVLSIESSTVTKTKPEAVVFRGKLLTDSDHAFDILRPRFEKLSFTPTLQHAQGQDVVTAMPGIVQVRESNPLINLVLFLATVVTTFLTGALGENDFNLVNGVLFSASILTILGAHELGHYFVARRYNAPVTLPY